MVSSTNEIATLKENVKTALDEITHHLEKGIIPFWLKRGIDEEYGGYLTCFDSFGEPTTDKQKYLVTQTRMIWGMSALYRQYKDEQFERAARQGVDFFIKHFWDVKNGGWFWKVQQNGETIDDGKVVYGQSFAIYCLAEYSIATGDERGLEYASETFDLLQKYCADTYNGGYYENLENDWTISDPGFCAGDRKSLDVHMHLMEAFTTLAWCSGKDIHYRKLNEVIQLIIHRMTNPLSGCGMNQFDLTFKPIPAINIRRTWNAERGAGEVIETPMDTTSYGHNVELAWLLNRATDTLGKPFDTNNEVVKKLVDHALTYGLDYELGGVYRDGPHAGEALVKDKEWWQNSEVLVGFLDAFERLADEKYFEAFLITWNFDKKFLINQELGEWRQLVNKEGKPIISDIGNPWKAIYHTGRSMLECKMRLERILERL